MNEHLRLERLSKQIDFLNEFLDIYYCEAKLKDEKVTAEIQRLRKELQQELDSLIIEGNK